MGTKKEKFIYVDEGFKSRFLITNVTKNEKLKNVQLFLLKKTEFNDKNVKKNKKLNV